MKSSQEPKYCIIDENGQELPNARIAKRDGLAPIPDDEPIMIFRAKDINSVQAIFVYANICRNPAHQRIVNSRMADFKEFQNKAPEVVREPD